MELSEGVIVGCDKNQQWLLPWFWDHYSKYSSYPVAFMDFGMTEEGRSFCEDKGLYVKAKEIELKEVSSAVSENWETAGVNGFWQSRSSWFMKVQACSLCPFETGIWIDLDCEIKGSLEPLFHCLHFGADFALTEEHPVFQENLRRRNRLLEDQTSYSSGVLVFKKDSEVIKLWLEESVKNNHLYKGDQDALSAVIYHQKPNIIELPLEYNWPVTRGDNPDALILHYDSGPGKVLILQQLKKEIAPLVKALSEAGAF